MKEIKFRAWDKRLNIFLDNPYFRSVRGILYGENEDIELLEYTGLKDKNGKEIYEGDIITYYGYSAYGRDKTKTIECIKWNDSACGFDLSYITTIDNGDIGLGCIEIEVIGNKFQNPELMKEAK